MAVDSKAWETRVAITKADAAERLVFGWASVVTDETGTAIIDHQGDKISIKEIEKASYSYVEESREAGEMHVRKAGHLVECVVFTPEKRAAMAKIDLGKGPVDMGIGPGPSAMWVGFRVDAETFAKVQSGELAELSIGGSAERVAA